MILNSAQITELADQIEAQSNLPNLTLYAQQLSINLANLVGNVPLKQSAISLITHLQSRTPPIIDQFLEIVRNEGNAALAATANELLKPTYYSPTGKPHDAIILGATAFVGRDDLRTGLKKFTNPSQFTTRVLIVRGPEPGGKSYSWEFIRHLAYDIGAVPVKLSLKGTSYTPREFLQDVYRLLGLDPEALPDLKDNPQEARIATLINDFKGRLNSLKERYWLVIDDLNDPAITRPVVETAYKLAYEVEDTRPPKLWVALLGYNNEIADVILRHAVKDDAEFPPPLMVSKFLELVSRNSSKQITSRRAKAIARALFKKFAKLDKEAMMKLTIDLETMGEKLQKGLHP
jgi:hypothetical protein